MRRTFVQATAIDARPMAEMNTTPLIDVLLVLLIMFILTVPAATHKVTLDLPVPAPGRAIPATTHLLAIDRAGGVALDGAALPAAALAPRLRAIAAEPRATLRFAPDPAVRYGRVDPVLAEVKRAGVTRLAFVG